MFIVPITQMPTLALGQEGNLVQGVNQGGGAPGSSFADVFKNAIDNVNKTQEISSQDGYNMAIGNADDMSTIMINSEKAATALEFAVQLTGKAVGAYNEIMRMQV